MSKPRSASGAPLAPGATIGRRHTKRESADGVTVPLDPADLLSTAAPYARALLDQRGLVIDGSGAHALESARAAGFEDDDPEALAATVLQQSRELALLKGAVGDDLAGWIDRAARVGYAIGRARTLQAVYLQAQSEAKHISTKPRPAGRCPIRGAFIAALREHRAKGRALLEALRELLRPDQGEALILSFDKVTDTYTATLDEPTFKGSPKQYKLKAIGDLWTEAGKPASG